MPKRLRVQSRWSVAGRVLLFVVAGAVLLAALAPVGRGLPVLDSQWVVGLLTSLTTLGLTVLFARWDGVGLSDVGAMPRRGSAVPLLAGFGLGLLLVAGQALGMKLAGHVQWVRAERPGLASVGLAVLGYGLLACREELAFRGYPLRRLDRRFGLWTAQLAVALVFAAEHVAGGYAWTNAVFGAAVGSLLFGMAAMAMRGLALPIGMHAAWNFGQWLAGEKETAGIWKPVVEQGYSAWVDHAGLVSYGVLFGATTVGFWWVYRRRGGVI